MSSGVKNAYTDVGEIHTNYQYINQVNLFYV